mmetsp:Transcript_12728/g.18580  ORF Transcript_12728/g.18580 Transcript_12728/m.18580 type:complete len:233 (+) Transcript_12728:405-1103(+)
MVISSFTLACSWNVDPHLKHDLCITIFTFIFIIISSIAIAIVACGFIRARSPPLIGFTKNMMVVLKLSSMCIVVIIIIIIMDTENVTQINFSTIIPPLTSIKALQFLCVNLYQHTGTIVAPGPLNAHCGMAMYQMVQLRSCTTPVWQARCPRPSKVVDNHGMSFCLEGRSRYLAGLGADEGAVAKDIMSDSFLGFCCFCCTFHGAASTGTGGGFHFGYFGCWRSLCRCYVVP